MKRIVTLALGAALLAGTGGPLAAQTVELRVGPGLLDGPATGRMFVIFSRDETPEPRFEAGSYNGGVPFFGVDVSGLAAGRAHTCARTAAGDVLCWGENDLGQLGAGDSGTADEPTAPICDG